DGIRRIPDNLESTSVLDADFDYLARHGVSGIRVFANWHFRDETLMDCSGSLRRRQLDKLVMLVDRAAARGLAVDLTFTIDTVKNASGSQCLTATAYKTA